MLYSTTKSIVLRGVMVVSAVAVAATEVMPPTDQPTTTFEPTFKPTVFEGECECERSSTDCSNGEFCNCEFGSTGFCEACLGYTTAEQCDNDAFLTPKGKSDCSQVCHCQ